MNGMKQFVGRQVLVSTSDGGAIQGTLWRVRRDGIELRKAREAVRGVELGGIIWLPSHSVMQIQVTAGGES